MLDTLHSEHDQLRNAQLTSATQPNWITRYEFMLQTYKITHRYDRKTWDS